ncbi:hypothetical protein GCM10028805_54070 [Spirosoma harenae]
MNTVKQIRATSTANLLAIQDVINQEIMRRQQRIVAIDKQLKIQDLPLRIVTRSTFLLDVKRNIENTVSVDQNSTIQDLLCQLPPSYWSDFGKSYPRYYSELKEALLIKKIDLKKLVE